MRLKKHRIRWIYVSRWIAARIEVASRASFASRKSGVPRVERLSEPVGRRLFLSKRGVGYNGKPGMPPKIV